MLSLSDLDKRIDEDEWVVKLVGTGREAVQGKRALLRSVYETFVAKYGRADRQVRVHHVPGRLEFIGKHTDYAGGPVMNMATERGFLAIGAPNGTREFHLQENNPEWAGLSLDLDSDVPHSLWTGDVHWFTYPCKTVERIQANFGTDSVNGMDIAFGSDLPPASGMSSSSSLMIMTFLTAYPDSNLPQHPLWRKLSLDEDLLLQAFYLACCENGQSLVSGDVVLEGAAGVGTFGGSQDQTAILTAKQGKLTVNTFCPTKWLEDVDLPEELAIVVCFSGFRAVKTQEVKDAFNMLSLRARKVPEAYNSIKGASYVYAGEMFDLDDVEQILAEAEAQNEAYRELDVLGRYKQFYADSRVFIPQAVSAIRNGDYTSLGGAINESHRYSVEHLRNIADPVQLLVDCARRAGAIGATGFGGGFGGSAYAVVERRRVEDFTRRWREDYASSCKPPHEPLFFTSTPACCACEVFA